MDSRADTSRAAGDTSTGRDAAREGARSASTERGGGSAVRVGCGDRNRSVADDASDQYELSTVIGDGNDCDADPADRAGAGSADRGVGIGSAERDNGTPERGEATGSAGRVDRPGSADRFDGPGSADRVGRPGSADRVGRAGSNEREGSAARDAGGCGSADRDDGVWVRRE
ncbi:hypothetical protein [Microlunatus parietis]|uniref:Uncharacterized protein n=1 Tax=Microlunatus parietis TaxID=682979 RepID=A0A7Y9I9P6_9ACTN|nr:hypothetical protein [Microlunatus parietis]NYE72845.1 hypothetical protein [Microlunatus parietis]